MKKQIFKLAMLLSVATTVLTSCKKNTEADPKPVTVFAYHDVMFKVTLTGTSISNVVTLPNESKDNYQTLSNVANYYTHHISAHTGDYMSITGTNSCTGSNSIMVQIFVDGSLQKTDYKTNATTTYSTAMTDIVLNN